MDEGSNLFHATPMGWYMERRGLGRCSLLDEKEVGAVWRRYKMHPPDDVHDPGRHLHPVPSAVMRLNE
jgi:hypothetical protein